MFLLTDEAEQNGQEDETVGEAEEENAKVHAEIEHLE